MQASKRNVRTRFMPVYRLNNYLLNNYLVISNAYYTSSFAYFVNSFLNIVIVYFFKGCLVKSEYTKHQPITKQDGKELISTVELNHQPCPSEDVRMQIL